MVRGTVLLLALGGCATSTPAADASYPLDAQALRDAVAPLDAARLDGGSEVRDDAATPPVDARATLDAGCDVSPNAGCSTGLACYFVPSNPGSTYERTCLDVGAATLGEICAESSVNSCGAGLWCADGRCQQYCTSSTSSACASHACIVDANFGADHGTCMP